MERDESNINDKGMRNRAPQSPWLTDANWRAVSQNCRGICGDDAFCLGPVHLSPSGREVLGDLLSYFLTKRMLI